MRNVTVPRARIRKVLDLSASSVKRFEELYPGASLTWILDLLLTRFVEATQESPDSLTREIAREQRRLLEE
jgi:hypothetical protein